MSSPSTHNPSASTSSRERAVVIEVEDQIARVRLNRPAKHNALNLAVFRGLIEAQRKLRRNRNVRAVVLTGEGVDFCSGLDIKSMLSSPVSMARIGLKLLPGQANIAQRVSTGWARLPIPVIAAIHGRCWGGGLQIALGADFRIARSDASLSIMEAKWGLVPDMGGTRALRALISRDQALKLTMTAEQLDGHTALSLGLVTEVADDPEARAMVFAAELIERSPDSLAAAKALYSRSWHGPEWLAYARETAYQLRLLLSRNQRVATARARGKDKAYTARGRW